MTPKCYGCKWRKDIPGDAHSECTHPLSQGEARLCAIMGAMRGRVISHPKLAIRANPAGVEGGWFMWPMNFDPTWLENCDGAEDK